MDDVLFLDANVLVSAAWKDNTRMQRFWSLEDVELITSQYAIAETERSLPTQEQMDRFHSFATRLRIIEDGTYEHIRLPNIMVSLRQKDVPVMQAAIAAQATHLITGDARDFGDYFGQTISGVEIIQPAEYLRRHSQDD